MNDETQEVARGERVVTSRARIEALARHINQQFEKQATARSVLHDLDAFAGGMVAVWRPAAEIDVAPPMATAAKVLGAFVCGAAAVNVVHKLEIVPAGSVFFAVAILALALAWKS